MTKPVCETCRFWSFEAGFGNHQYGNCHRYPPAVADESEVVFPCTRQNEWCGEWVSRD